MISTSNQEKHTNVCKNICNNQIQLKCRVVDGHPLQNIRCHCIKTIWFELSLQMCAILPIGTKLNKTTLKNIFCKKQLKNVWKWKNKQHNVLQLCLVDRSSAAPRPLLDSHPIINVESIILSKMYQNIICRCDHPNSKNMRNATMKHHLDNKNTETWVCRWAFCPTVNWAHVRYTHTH